VLAQPSASSEKLASLFRGVARLVFREQGQFRTVENFGVRPLAFPIRKAGSRYEEVRWVQAMFDCAPPALPTIGALLGGDRDVLQFKTLRAGPELLGEFRAKKVPERLKRFAASRRYETELFDPETLELGPRPRAVAAAAAAASAAASTASAATAAAAAAAAGAAAPSSSSLSSPAAAREALR